jgi:hypothetical protein
MDALVRACHASPVRGPVFRRSKIEDVPMLIFQVAGGLFVLLFLAAAMTGIEGNEHR